MRVAPLASSEFMGSGPTGSPPPATYMHLGCACNALQVNDTGNAKFQFAFTQLLKTFTFRLALSEATQLVANVGCQCSTLRHSVTARLDLPNFPISDGIVIVTMPNLTCVAGFPFALRFSFVFRRISFGAASTPRVSSVLDCVACVEHGNLGP
jgi:hypothetical protein